MLSDCNGKLTDFFNWRPPSLYPSLTASRSKGTRDPSFYDKLLAENLILHILKSFRPSPCGLLFYRRHCQTRPSAMQSELSVAEFYAHTTAVFCLNVASVLALQPMLQIG
jgi:hypothetical protein